MVAGRNQQRALARKPVQTDGSELSPEDAVEGKEEGLLEALAARRRALRRCLRRRLLSRFRRREPAMAEGSASSATAGKNSWADGSSLSPTALACLTGSSQRWVLNYWRYWNRQ